MSCSSHRSFPIVTHVSFMQISVFHFLVDFFFFFFLTFEFALIGARAQCCVIYTAQLSLERSVIRFALLFFFFVLWYEQKSSL